MTRAPLLAACAAFAAGGGIAALAPAPRGPAPLVVNESASLPRGLYRLTNRRPVVGAVVAFRQPPSARAYLSGLGAPADMRLLKRVTAQGGEVVCADGRTLRWPRGTVTVAARDRRGVTLPRWTGCRALAPDEALLLGDSGHSFDSRYFGPVRRPALEGVYVEVVRW